MLVEINPDRPNIFLASYPRPNHGDTKLENILSPLADELINKRQDFPLTLIYGNLATIAECFLYFDNRMGNMQYEPIGSAPLAKNRMFSQFHAQYPDHERERMVQELVDGKSKLRIVFVTVAFGLRIDVKNIRRVIHIGVPHTLEEYFQEAGRCGRDGLPGNAVIYYNSYDISAAKKMSQSMRDYVKSNKCKREMILSYFGYKLPNRSGPDHMCCDFHQQHCQCEDCILISAAQMFELKDNTQLQKIALAGVHVVSATCMFCLLQLCKTFSRSKSLKRNSLTKVSLLKSTTFNVSKIIHMGMRDKLHANG